MVTSFRSKIIANNSIENEKFQLKLKIDGEITVLEEAEYMEEVIHERQKEIDKIDRIMGDVRDIAKDFCQEVNMQGDKLVDVDSNMSKVADNTAVATKQLKEANKRSKSNGKCLIVFAALVLCAVGALIGILFGTGVI
jgi:t-SNARE complex subunit (syntaxin)